MCTHIGLHKGSCFNLDNENYENSSVVKIEGKNIRGYKLGFLRNVLDDSRIAEEVVFGFIIPYAMHPPFCAISRKRSKSAAVVILKFLSSPGIMTISIPAITAGSVEPLILKMPLGRSCLFAS